MAAPGQGAGRGQPLRAVRPAGVAGGGEQRGDLGAVQRAGLQVRGREQPGGLGGALGGPPGRAAWPAGSGAPRLRG